jgi:acetyltransferase
LEIYHKAAKAQKPIIMMKLGRSALGMAAAQSHTGKMVGMDDLWNAVFTQKGVVRVETLDELVETSILFAKARRPQGPGIGIFASSGGGASISTDQAGLHGLELAELSGQTLAELKNVLPDYASIGNPLDGGPLGEKRYTRCLELFAKDSNINILLLPLTIVPDGFGVERARRLVEWNKSLNKPLVVLWLGGSLVGQAIRIVERSDIPIFRSEDRCIKALKAFSEYYRWEKEFSTCPIQSTISEADQGAFDQFACARGLAFDDPTSQKAILEHFGIPKPREGVARSLDEAFRVAQEIGYPVALKLLSPQIIHKTESGAVEIGIQDEAGLEKAHSALLEAVKGRNPEAEIKGILVQEMIRDGAEFLVGMYQDPELGPVVTCGLGGIFVEILKDIALRIPPFDNSIARSMVQELKGHGVLKGFRGLRKLDSNALIDAITRFSRMCIFLKDRVAEMEINPLMVLEEGKGVRAVDCRFIEKHAQDCEK